MNTALEHKADYVNLIEEFLRKDLDTASFADAFVRLRQQDQSAMYTRADAWPERYDVQLTTAYQRGELDSEAFARRWQQLWEYEGEEDFMSLIDAVAAACGEYTTDPELTEDPMYFDDAGLYQYVQALYLGFGEEE